MSVVVARVFVCVCASVFGAFEPNTGHRLQWYESSFAVWETNEKQAGQARAGDEETTDVVRGRGAQRCSW